MLFERVLAGQGMTLSDIAWSRAVTTGCAFCTSHITGTKRLRSSFSCGVMDKSSWSISKMTQRASKDHSDGLAQRILPHGWRRSNGAPIYNARHQIPGGNRSVSSRINRPVSTCKSISTVTRHTPTRMARLEPLALSGGLAGDDGVLAAPRARSGQIGAKTDRFHIDPNTGKLAS